jgi:hypothetical protein
MPGIWLLALNLSNKALLKACNTDFAAPFLTLFSLFLQASCEK